MEIFAYRAFDIPRFCAAYSIGRTRVYQEIKEGRLRVFKVGRRTLISVQAAGEWQELMEGLSNGPPDG